MKLKQNVVALPNPESATVNHKLVARWGGHDSLFIHGWLGLPVTFLEHYPELKPYGLTAGEAMFIIQLMAYKWTEAAPFPSYKTLAKRMGVTDKMVRRYAAAVEAKGYLVREGRIGRSNSFNLSPLFEALREAVEQKTQAA